MKWFSGFGIAVLAVMLAGPSFALVTDVLIDPSNAGYGEIVGPNMVEIFLDIGYDPDAGPVKKVFNTDGMGGIITLVENIHVGPGPCWTDWHEQLMVLNAAGDWVVSPDTDNLWWGNGVNGGDPATSNPPADIQLDHPRDLLAFYWVCPLPPSTNITITKDILVPEGMQTFAVWQWPTIPEPSVMLLAGLGLLALLKRRK